MKQSCTERLTGVFKRGHQALTLEAMALQDSCVNPGFLLSLPARQTQISATTSQTGGLLPLLCLLSCAGFVSVYRTLLFLLPGCFLPLLLFGFFSSNCLWPFFCSLFVFHSVHLTFFTRLTAGHEVEVRQLPAEVSCLLPHSVTLVSTCTAVT